MMDGGYRTKIGYSWTPERFSVAPKAGRVLVQGGKALNAEGRALLAASQRGSQPSTTGNGEAKRYGAPVREMRDSVSIGRTPLKHRPLSGPVMVEHTCEMCQAKFESGSMKALVRWCPACREVRRKVAAKTWVKENRTGRPERVPPPPQECERCHQRYATPQSRWCRECQVEMHRERARKRSAERRAEKKGMDAE